MLWLPEAEGLRGAALLVLTAGRGRRSRVLWVLGLPFALLFMVLLMCTDHSPPVLCFLLPFPLPKSIYEGNFGCGYLKERRASGLVFCENTASVYRALFVSSRGFLPCVYMEAARMRAGALTPSPRMELHGMLLAFLAWFPLPCVLVL